MRNNVINVHYILIVRIIITCYYTYYSYFTYIIKFIIAYNLVYLSMPIQSNITKYI